MNSRLLLLLGIGALMGLETDAVRLAAQEPPLPAASAPTAPVVRLELYPTQVTFTSNREVQRFVVLAHHADGRSWEVTSAVRWQIDDPKIVQFDRPAIARPLADGTTKLTATWGQHAVHATIRVQELARERPVEFHRDVQPILTKAGCNSGGCHGAQHGRGGFRLSLFGFDPWFDHSQIVQSAEGRRVVISDPERSILLRKPVLLMEHGGGQKLHLGSREYETLRQWLQEGAAEPSANEPTVQRLEVFPSQRLLVPGEQQTLVVTAIWSDGKRQDVTATAQFDSLNEAVAQVTSTGLVTAKAAGETHIMIRFAGQATVAQMTLPYARISPYPKLERHNFIDDLLIAKWKDLGLLPSLLCSDEEFYRRIHLDVIGTLPEPQAIRQFLADRDPDKRRKAIDAILDRPEFVDYWALKWGDLLRINRDALTEKGMWSFHNWVRAQLRNRVPMDEFVRDIITAEGSTFTEGPANFFRIGRSADDWAETVAQVFLGVRMQCAKCHHHPFEKWSQDDYYGMSAFFVRLGTKNSQEFGLFGQESVVFLRPTGEATHPRNRVVVKPHPLDGPILDDEFDRRRKLAEWMTTKDNPFFARNLANRFWGYLMGRGLVEPLDDMRATNPASNPALLDALAHDFAEHRFDLRHLLRTILQSRAYQLESTVTPGNAADVANTYFTRYTVRRLTAEPLADAIDFATGTREKYQGLPLGVRAIQLPDPRVRSYLMDVFGRPARQIVCECERTTQPNIAQALHLLNGEFLNKKISDPKGRIEEAFRLKKPLPAIVEELYLVTLSRLPTEVERIRALEWIAQAPTPKEGAQDLLWVLLNSKEFLFNH